MYSVRVHAALRTVGLLRHSLNMESDKSFANLDGSKRDLVRVWQEGMAHASRYPTLCGLENRPLGEIAPVSPNLRKSPFIIVGFSKHNHVSDPLPSYFCLNMYNTARLDECAAYAKYLISE